MTTVARTLRKRDTWAEKLLWSWIRGRRFSAFKFRRQHPYPPYVLDFFCIKAMLNIELDGDQHWLPQHSLQDVRRDAWLESRGIKVLRFANRRLRREKELVQNAIWRALNQRWLQAEGEQKPDFFAANVRENEGCDSKIVRAVPPHPDPLP